MIPSLGKSIIYFSPAVACRCRSCHIKVAQQISFRSTNFIRNIHNILVYKNIFAVHIFNFLFFSMNSGVWSCDSVLLEFKSTRREILVLFAYRLNVYNIRIIIVCKKTIYSIVPGSCFIDLIS